jgi:hypothetical protein
LFWGVAVLKADQYLLNLSVLVGNGLILFGSLFLLDLQSVTGKKGRIMAIVLLIIFMALFFVLRIIYYPPSPTVENGILLFNTALPVFALLGIVFIGVWLPGCIKMAGMLATTLQDKRLTFLFGSVYAMTIVAALIFMAARTIPVVVASFVGIVLCFVMLIASNIIVGKMLQQKGDN